MTVAEQAGVANTTHFNVLLKEVLAEAASALEAEEAVAAVLAQMDAVSCTFVTTSPQILLPTIFGLCTSFRNVDSRYDIWPVSSRQELGL